MMRRPETGGPVQVTWDRFWGSRADVREVYPAVSDLLAEITGVLPDPAGRRVLEVGAGIGREAHVLAERGVKVVALDFSPEALRLSRQVSAFPRFVRGDALALPFPDQGFDLVYHQGLLEHFRDPFPLLRENRRVLRPGGLVLVDVPQKFHVYTLMKHALMIVDRWFAGWETQYSPREIRRIVEAAGFRCIRRYGYSMRPGLAYRVVRQVLLRVGVRLPLEPRLGPLDRAYRAWHRVLRRLEETRFGPYCTLTVGVIARREPDAL